MGRDLEVGVAKLDRVDSASTVASDAPRKPGKGIANKNGAPTLLSVLYDEHEVPYDRASFHQFLESERAQENLEFWLEAETYAQRFENVDGRRRLSIKENSDESQLDAAIRVFEHYVVPGAPEEINIRSEFRKSLIKFVTDAKERNDASVLPEPLFYNAQKDVMRTLEMDKFERFLVHATFTNISQPERSFRKRMSIFCYFFFASFMAFMIVIDSLTLFPDVFQKADYRYYKLLGFPTLCATIGLTMSSYTGF